jgi:hypothetical protein
MVKDKPAIRFLMSGDSAHMQETMRRIDEGSCRKFRELVRSAPLSHGENQNGNGERTEVAVMAKKPVKKKKVSASKKPWPKCSWCDNLSALTWVEDGERKHACGKKEHYKKGYQPKKQKPSGIAPGTKKKAKKKVVRKVKVK